MDEARRAEELAQKAEEERRKREIETEKAFHESFSKYYDAVVKEQAMLDSIGARIKDRDDAMLRSEFERKEAEAREKVRLDDIALNGSNDANNKAERDAFRMMLGEINPLLDKANKEADRMLK